MMGVVRSGALRLARDGVGPVARGARRAGPCGGLTAPKAAASPATRRGLSSTPLQQGGGGSQWRPRHHSDCPSHQLVRAMRERSEQRDPQIQQRRQRLEPGQHHFFATSHPGLEAVVAAELLGPAIGATNVHPGTSPALCRLPLAARRTSTAYSSTCLFHGPVCAVPPQP